MVLSAFCRRLRGIFMGSLVNLAGRAIAYVFSN